MNIIKKFLNLIFNPFNSMIDEKTTTKLTNGFSAHGILVFIISLIITAIIFVLSYFVL